MVNIQSTYWDVQRPLYDGFTPNYILTSIVLAFPRAIKSTFRERKNLQADRNKTADVDLNSHSVIDKKGFLLKLVSESLYLVSIRTCEVLVERSILYDCGPEKTYKYFKNIKASAIRKNSRYDRIEAAGRIFITACRCAIVYHFARLVVDISVVACNVYRRVKRLQIAHDCSCNHSCTHEKHQDNTDIHSVIRQTHKEAIQVIKRKAMISLIALFVEALGAAVGTLLVPGSGTLILDRIGKNVVYMFS